MDEQTTCVACGNPLLKRTAASYDGKCIPCARGYRKGIDEGKRYYAEQKEREKLPDAVFWRSLVKRVNDLGFHTLSEPEKYFFAVCLLDGEIYDGGFEQYFTNSSADYYSYALKGLQEIGDFESLKLLVSAKRVLFADRNVPSTQDRRLFTLGNGGYVSDRTTGKLDVLSDSFACGFERLKELLRAYAEKHNFWSHFEQENNEFLDEH